MISDLPISAQASEERSQRALFSWGASFFSLPHSELEILCVDDWLSSTHTRIIHAGAGLSLRFYKPHQFFINGYPQGRLRTSARMWQEKGRIKEEAFIWVHCLNISTNTLLHTCKKVHLLHQLCWKELNSAVNWSNCSVWILYSGQTWWSSNTSVHKGIYVSARRIGHKNPQVSEF